MAESRLHELSKHGQSVWIDYLSRDMLAEGELARMMREDAVVGVTSNPTIFQKAISQGDRYDDQLRELLESETDPKEIFLQLSARDIEAALDLLAPVNEKTGYDGFVSWEVDPRLAYDREATFDEAMRLHGWLDRPNLYVKIPATKPGLGAIEDCVAHGKNINITLIFSLRRYAEVVEAYLRGLERLVAAGGNPKNVYSVASFFVSRVDTEADKRLEAILKGKDANPQRCLWASTSTKNPEYRDVLYVEELIGPETVNTMPQETMEDFQDHGEIRGDTVTKGVKKAHALFDDIAKVGVDYDDVTETLELEGVQKFADSFAELFDSVAKKREALVTA